MCLLPCAIPAQLVFAVHPPAWKNSRTSVSVLIPRPAASEGRNFGPGRVFAQPALKHSRMTMGSSPYPQDLFSLLPRSKTPWTEFVFSFGTQALLIAFALWVQILSPEILHPAGQNYHAIELVPTPAPVNHEPQPLPQLQKPVEVAELDPAPAALRLPA